MSANKSQKKTLIYKEAVIYEISTIRRQSRIKAISCRRNHKVRDRPSGAEKPQQAEVIAVGPGGVIDGKEVKMEVKTGDQVIYSKYAGTDVKIEEEEYIIVKQSDILAILA